jgi:hypothetical protein
MMASAVIGRVSLAQTFSASIAGAVTDPSGAMVSGVKLELQNMDTHLISPIRHGRRRKVTKT